MKALYVLLLLIVSVSAGIIPPTGTKYIIKITADKTKIGSIETNFAYQYDFSSLLTSNSDFKNNITTVNNVSICKNPGNDTLVLLPKIVKLDLTNNKGLVYFDGTTSTSTNPVFYMCVGNTINQINSSSALTNSGITNFWGLDEFTNTATTTDDAGGLTGTCTNMIMSVPSLFGNGATISGTNPRIVASAPEWIANTTKFTVGIGVTLGSDLNTTKRIFIIYTSSNERIFGYIATNNIKLYIVTGGVWTSVLTSIADLQNTGFHYFTFVYDGTQSTNTTKVKIFIDGVLKTRTSTGTIPAVTPTLTSAVFIIGENTGDALGYNGTYDNVELRSANPNDDVILTKSNMLMSPNTFWSNQIEVIPAPTLKDTLDTLRINVATDDVGCTFQWQKNKINITDSTRSGLTIIADSALYATKPVYRCIITNSNGSAYTISREWLLNPSTASGQNRWLAFRPAFKIGIQ
jgi:hypothetical protein